MRRQCNGAKRCTEAAGAETIFGGVMKVIEKKENAMQTILLGVKK